MLSLKVILHPTDFSPLSEHAFHLACSLARDHNSQLIVLHVAVPPVVGYGGVATPPPQGDWQAMEERLRRVQSQDPLVCVRHRLEEGDPVSEILRVADETHCDLIVMGTHGHTGLERLLMGSVAEQVVRKSGCPVVTVKIPVAKTTST